MLSVVDMSGRLFPQKILQLNQLKHKQLPPQNHSATLTKDNQLTHLHYLANHETVPPSQKDDCHPILADFGDDQFFVRISDKRENIIVKALD